MADLSIDDLRALIKGMRVPPDIKVKLPKDHDPGATAGWLKKKDGTPHLELTVRAARRISATAGGPEHPRCLVILQAMDASGKDGTIKHVISGVNPQGVSVHRSRCRRRGTTARLSVALPAAPARARPIGIFNRSHYEEVLVVRVHPELLDNEHLPRPRRGRHLERGASARSTTGKATWSTTGAGSSSCS